MERAIPGDPTWAELSAPHLARYLLAGEYAKNRRVLDAGTGSGYGAHMLKIAGASYVEAVDIDPDTVRYAEDQFADEDRKAEQADPSMSFENSTPPEYQQPLVD